MATQIKDLTTLSDLLHLDERGRPGLILVHSRHCAPCRHLRPQVVALMNARKDFDFYEVELEAFSAPGAFESLGDLLKPLNLYEIPAQIMLTYDGDAFVVRHFDMAELEQEMDGMCCALFV